jgi:inosine-uridine nucleoside N-ribohydrolase
MSLLQSVVLGIVQGLTEFLPISSSAHLRIVPAIFGWQDPGAQFTAIIQLGTMAAVVIYFWRDLLGVTTVHGNNTLANTTRNGLIALELGKIDVPLAMGAVEPLVQPSVGIASGHGKSGLDGHEFADPRLKPISQHAVDFMRGDGL